MQSKQTKSADPVKAANSSESSVMRSSQEKSAQADVGFGLLSGQLQPKTNPFALAQGKLGLPLQTQLTVGQPDDPYEQEADKIASQVVQNYSQVSRLQQKVSAFGLPLSVSPKRIQTRVMRLVQTSLQRNVIQKKCDACEQDEGNIQAKFIQFQGSGEVVSSEIESQIQTSRGGGQPLDSATMSFMEQSFNSDFSGVRIHTNNQAVQMNQALNAHAFTVGKDIFFNEGRYQPNSSAGVGLLAHELTHVVQQGAAVQKKSDTRASLPFSHMFANPAVQAKFSSSGNASDNQQVFRKEIAQFQQENPQADLMLQQQRILQAKPVDQVQMKNNARQLRKCSGGEETDGGGSSTPSTPLTFSSLAFSPGSSGPLNVTLGSTSVTNQSSNYVATGKVKASGGTDALAKDWEAGFIQTLHSTSRTAHYKGKSPKTQMQVRATTPARDAFTTSGAPWYDPGNARGTGGEKGFTTTNSNVSVRFSDAPRTGAPWTTPDAKSKLDKYDGKDKFSYWMIARQKSAPNTIKYLNHGSWEVDWGVAFDYASKAGTKTVKNKTGKTTHSGSGTGKGSATPVLSGPIPNNSATVNWV